MNEIQITERGYRYLLTEIYQNKRGEMTRILAESSAVGDYEDSLDRPGSSFLWVGHDHHFNREEITELIEFMQYWLDNKRLSPEST